MVLYHILLCFEERNLDIVWTRMLRRSRKSNLFGAGKKILAIQSYIIPYHLTLNLVNKSLACFLCWSRNSLRYLESQRPLEGNYSKIKWLVGLGKSISGGTKQHLGNNLMLKAAADPQLVKLTKTNTYFLWEMRIWPPMFLCSPYCLKVYSLTFFKHCNWKLYIFGKCSCRLYSSEQFVLTSMGLFMWVRTGVNVRFETVLYLSNLVLSNVVWWSLEVTLAVIYGKKTF